MLHPPKLRPMIKSSRLRILFIFITVFLTIAISSFYLINLNQKYPRPIVSSYIPNDANIDSDQPKEVITSNTSIAFYVIAGASQKGLDPDLRGTFWEPQLKYYKFNHSITYLSDGPLSVNGVDFLVLPEGKGNFEDKQFCIRAPETWIHFNKYNLDKKWYFRGIHDTYINMPELLKFINELENKGDPMKTYNFAYNMHEYGHMYYPHGGTGYLFSNYAMRKFYRNIDRFRRICQGAFDDVALTPFFQGLGLNVMDYQTNKFIVTWPLTQTDVILKKKYAEVKDCPPYYQLYEGGPKLLPCPAHTAASVHFHRVPMNLVHRIIQETPPNFAVYFPDPNTPLFCKMDHDVI
ncbi:hypothetical protein M9Y10_037893 [Tritrichomonas musculus]|uniref:Uncharacterized protein n=1 Tax=Tritrichomonas musculus TaxID=1915356 RepID=A0ABR2K6W6_9EUKA